MGETFFSLAYEIMGVPTHKITHFKDRENEELLTTIVDLNEEKRLSTILKITAYQHQTIILYSKKVLPHSFIKGDLVLYQVT